MQDEKKLNLIPFSPDLAKANPNAFIDNLFKLINNNPLAAKEWELVSRRYNLITSDHHLNTNSWVSFNDPETGIELGTQPVPKELMGKLLFLGESFSYEDEMLYRAVHEISHKFLSSAKASVANLKNNLDNILTSIRVDNPNLGMSALGSMEFYKSQGVKVQAKEDFVELITMYIFSPEYFHSYLQYISKPENSKELEELGIHPISTESALKIENRIIKIITKELT